MAAESPTGGPRVMRTRGRTPTVLEGRSVIFIANLLSLFFGNRGGAKLLEDEIKCVDSYGGRLLPIVGLLYGKGDHVLILEREPDRDLTDFFQSLGLNLPEIRTFSRKEYFELGTTLKHGGEVSHPLLDFLRKHPADLVDGYVTDKTIDRIAAAIGKRTLSTPEGSHRGNNKLLLHQHLEESGLPVPPTHLAETPGDVDAALKALADEGHRAAAVKAQIGASGIGLLKTPTCSPRPTVPEPFFHEGACLVQAWLEPGFDGVEEIFSPSVQIYLNEDTIHLYDLTEQILDPDESIHQGNESPPLYLTDHPGLSDELHRQAGEVATWLHAQGYRGVGSVDFLVTCGKDSSFTAYVCEINARVTGATYPSVLARHFVPEGAWRMRNLELSRPMPGGELLERLQRHGELFDSGDRRGIIPINFNLDPDGRVSKGQFLAVAEEIGYCRHLLDTARSDLPVVWDYTHDR